MRSRGAQRHYSDLAIATALTPGLVGDGAVNRRLTETSSSGRGKGLPAAANFAVAPQRRFRVGNRLRWRGEVCADAAKKVRDGEKLASSGLRLSKYGYCGRAYSGTRLLPARSGIRVAHHSGRPPHSEGRLGHPDVSTIQIYTHVLIRGGSGVRSPVDNFTAPILPVRYK